MSEMCSYTKFALLKSIINIVWYQTLQNANKRRNRTFDIFLLIVSKVICTFVTVRPPTFSSHRHCTSSRVSKYVFCTQLSRSNWVQLM